MKTQDNPAPAHTARPWHHKPGVRAAAVFAAGALSAVVATSLFAGDPAPQAGTSTASADPAAPHATFTCAMHPQVQHDGPGLCPICGMELTPVASAEDESLAHDEVRLGARARALAGIVTAVVEPRDVRGAERDLLGQVVADEGKLSSVTTWAAGRVDRLLVNTTGARVRRGQPVAKVYSPDMYAAHQTLLAAIGQLAAADKAGASGAVLKRGAEAQRAAARQKLRLLGASAADLVSMEKAARPFTAFTVRAQSSGVVTRRLVQQGDTVAAGAPLLMLADLRRVWVELDAYERDLAHVAVGQSVALRIDALARGAGEDSWLSGTITFIDPTLDPATRTARLRVEVENPDGVLKPGMYARAVLKGGHSTLAAGTDAPLPLVIPRTAPLFAGRRSLVYVEKYQRDGARVYQARPVKLGPLSGDVYPVLAGLSRGERVVRHGAFALDADLEIRGGLSLMRQPDDGEPSPLDDMVDIAPDALARLRPVLAGYLDVQEALADDGFDRAQKRGKTWQKAVRGVTLPGVPRATARAWHALKSQVTADIDAFTRARDLTGARQAFGHLTRDIERLLARFGNPSPDAVKLAYCPMAFSGRGGHWFQRGDVVDNVYFGHSMKQCGEIQDTLPAAARFVPKATPNTPGTPDMPATPDTPEAEKPTQSAGGHHGH